MKSNEYLLHASLEAMDGGSVGSKKGIASDPRRAQASILSGTSSTLYLLHFMICHSNKCHKYHYC